MPLDDQYRLLGLGPAASVIVGIEVLELGRRVVVRGLYDPHQRKPFEMVFTKCRDVHLECLSDDSWPELETPLIGIFLGQEEHRSPAVITTSAFELSVLYGEFLLVKSDTDPKSAGVCPSGPTR
jgi:hypothetical protein